MRNAMHAPTMNAHEAAELLGCHVNSVYTWLRSGALEGKRRGREWRIPTPAVERMAEERASLAEAAQGIANAGQLLCEFAGKREAVADKAWEDSVRIALAKRDKCLDAANEATASRERMDDLLREALEATEAALRAGDRLREAKKVVETAQQLRAEGLEKGQASGLH